MKAFYKDDCFLAKVYDEGIDWKVISATFGGCSDPELWFSQCISDPESWGWRDSVTSAMKRAVEYNGLVWDDNCFQIC